MQSIDRQEVCRDDSDPVASDLQFHTRVVCITLKCNEDDASSRIDSLSIDRFLATTEKVFEKSRLTFGDLDRVTVKEAYRRK